MLKYFFIRENITPRGDGNPPRAAISTVMLAIRENITPRGDGNLSASNSIKSSSSIK